MNAGQMTFSKSLMNLGKNDSHFTFAVVTQEFWILCSCLLPPKHSFYFQKQQQAQSFILKVIVDPRDTKVLVFFRV